MPGVGGKIYFIGIGGTAMAGAALMAHELGFEVGGSDQNLYPPTVDELREKHIPFTEGYAAANLADTPDLVVLGNAISRGNPELETALNRRLPLISLPDFIAQYVIRSRESIVVAGTHGKTTTTSLVTHILHQSGTDCGYMIGGVSGNFERSAAIGSADCFVIEGDEYDTSIFDPRSKFLLYRPTHVLINNIEFDHADIFASLAEVEKSFARLVKIIPENGVLITNADNASCMRLAATARCPVITFGEAAGADYRLTGFEDAATTAIRFEIRGRPGSLSTPLHGRHNALNTLAAMALLEHKGIKMSQVAAALDSFRGVRRRLELRFEDSHTTIIEDFAHHPTAIAANLETLRSLYPGRRLVVLVEPRSNTMVRNFFQAELTAALGQADCVFIDAIYRAEKYADSERLDLMKLRNELAQKGKSVYLLPPEDRAAFVTGRLEPRDLVCFMTNGNFGGLIGEVVSALEASSDNR